MFGNPKHIFVDYPGILRHSEWPKESFQRSLANVKEVMNPNPCTNDGPFVVEHFVHDEWHCRQVNCAMGGEFNTKLAELMKFQPYQLEILKSRDPARSHSFSLPREFFGPLKE